MDFEISNVGIMAAVAAGAISFLSPCVLPLVPGYISFIAGNSARERSDGERGKMAAALLSLFFVLGFSTVFVALGASATALSRLLRAYSFEAGLVGGAVIVLFGLFTMGLVSFPWLQRDARYHGAIPGGGPLGAYLLGLAFAFGWTPCIGPILGAILTVSAVSATASNGIALLALYSLGLGIPFVLAAVFTQSLMSTLPRMRRAGRILQVGAGGIMIVMGLAMMTGQMTRFAFWLLETFPAFGSIG
jgi:cytochrome c-type biogenesis protein